MAYPLTTAGVGNFLNYLSDKGLVQQQGAASMRTACDRIFSALSPDEQQNLAGLDVASAVQRFMNKNPGALSPESAGVYRSRVHRALEMLGRYNADPVAFRPEASKRNGGTAAGDGRPVAAAKPPQKRRQPAAPTDESPPETQKHHSPPVVGSVTLTLPLRPDFVAQFIVPRDLTIKEAKRLGAYFQTIPMDYEPS
jgi:hypothetical protein